MVLQCLNILDLFRILKCKFARVANSNQPNSKALLNSKANKYNIKEEIFQVYISAFREFVYRKGKVGYLKPQTLPTAKKVTLLVVFWTFFRWPIL